MTDIVRKFNGESIKIVNEGDQIWFWGVEVAKILGYSNPSDAVAKHIKPDEKRIVNKAITYAFRISENGESKVKQAITYPKRVSENGESKEKIIRASQINECGLYRLIFSSKLPMAEEFKRWVFHEVIPSIRKTGAYELPRLKHNQLTILSEADLHYQVVREIRKRFPNLMMVVQAGELQDTHAKRTKMWKKGFAGGQPDIMITNPHIKYAGMCIEMKTPKGCGKLSLKQNDVLERYRQMGWNVIVSDDLVTLLFALKDYAEGVREICLICKKRFKSLDTLSRHKSGFHKGIA